MKRDKKLDKEIQGLIDAVELGIDWGIPIPQQQYEQYQKIKEGTLWTQKKQRDKRQDSLDIKSQ